MSSYIFRQLFDQKSSTYTYIIADRQTKKAIIIDPVLDQVDRDIILMQELGLTLEYIFDTHIHADHITGSGKIRAKTGAQIIMSQDAGLAVDIAAKDGDILTLGDLKITILLTPGHTVGCASLHVGESIFTGDALLIRKTGRTDFQ